MKNSKKINKLVDESNFLLKERKFIEATPLYIDLVKEFPDNFHLQFNLALCYLNTDKYNECIDLLDNINKKFPLNAEVNYLKGVCFESLKKLDEALEFYKKALKIDKKHQNSWLRCAIIHRKIKDFDKALELFTYVYNNFSHPLGVATDIAITLFEKGELEQSEKILKEIISKKPDNHLAKQFLALIYHKTPGKKALALKIEKEISGKIDFTYKGSNLNLEITEDG